MTRHFLEVLAKDMNKSLTPESFNSVPGGPWPAESSFKLNASEHKNLQSYKRFKSEGSEHVQFKGQGIRNNGISQWYGESPQYYNTFD